MNRTVVFVAVALVAGLGLYFLLPREAGKPGAPPPDLPVQSQPAESPAPEIQYPVQAAPAAATDAEPEPLPELGADSDATLQESAAGLLGVETLEEIGFAEDFIRRFVVTVDNLARYRLPVRLRPVASTPGAFVVAGDEDNPVLSEENYRRYDRIVALFVALPSPQLADVYARNYPLFQEAYVELGYPDGYFNDRLVEVVDHLLEEPQIDGPIRLVRPHVMFKFADPSLEALSPGQKLLIRVGPDNARRVRDKLREFRDELTGGS